MRLTQLGKIKEDSDRRIADGSLITSELDATGLAVHLKYGDAISTLIATIEELAC